MRTASGGCQPDSPLSLHQHHATVPPTSVRPAEFDSSAQIGLVLLFGVVVNNAILLVSRFRTEVALILKAKLGGDPEREAALFPGSRRTPAASTCTFCRRRSDCDCYAGPWPMAHSSGCGRSC